MVGPYTVFWYALVTAAATGLGAIPFLFFRDMSRRWLGLSNALAAGLMGAASSTLIYEGIADSAPRVLLGVVLGLAFIAGTQRLLRARPEAQLGSLRGADATRGILIVAIMTLHSVTEGIAVGVSFGGGLTLGLFITIDDRRARLSHAGSFRVGPRRARPGGDRRRRGLRKRGGGRGGRWTRQVSRSR